MRNLVKIDIINLKYWKILDCREADKCIKDNTIKTKYRNKKVKDSTVNKRSFKII